MQHNKKKLVFVLPSWSPSAADHMLHLLELLHFVRSTGALKIRLIVERGDPVPDLPADETAFLRLSGRNVRGAWRVLRALIAARLSGYRAIYAHYSFYAGLIGGGVARLSGGTLWYWNCATVGDYMTGDNGQRPCLRERVSVEIPLRATLRLATALVTGTNSMARHYNQTFGVPLHRIHVMANWVRLERFALQSPEIREVLRRRLGVPEASPLVLFVHRLAARKGAELLVPIMDVVLRDVPRAHFWVVGDGPLKGQVEDDLRRHHLDRSVRMLGEVPNCDLPPYYHAADLLIMPSLEEGFPRVLLEAMASGLPFVATNVGGVAEIVTDIQRPCLVPPGEPLRFAERVVELLSKPDLRTLQRAEGLLRVEAFSLERAANTFLSIVADDTAAT